MTQEDVANRVGVSTQFYGRIERGYALPSVTTLRRMLDVLDLRADALLGVTGTEAASDEAATQAQIEADNPHLRRLMRYLRRASPVTLEVVEVLLDQIEKAEAILHGDRRDAGSAGDEEGVEDAGSGPGSEPGDRPEIRDDEPDD